ncbi:hypothetical protein A0J61_00437 [Choanephora cucurbitarum]|uniref:Uncharacterized protein n=1 Tax=Choanephora cucurbitarum TaxID=101091 RepID=A0A1C7NR79_9FUNG|nr:hypothetical protein A0J61_00437 [Choanephora cucurbitarum]
MSKSQSNYYYAYSSPPLQNNSGSASDQQDVTKNSGPPPSYDEALQPPLSSPTSNSHQNALDGYVLDNTAPTQLPGTPSNTSDYGSATPNSNQDTVPLLSNHDDDLSFQGRPLPPGYSVHNAAYKTTTDGVVSRDKHINEDGEALVRFLYQHNTPPRLIIHFHGYHEETTWTVETVRNRDGDEVQQRVPTTRQIDDFKFDLDCSADVSSECQGIYLLPDPKTGEQKRLRQLCDEYVHSKNALKELKMTKEIEWDFNNLTRALTTAIRDSGFYDFINITYSLENHETVVKTDEKISKLADNKYIRFFFFITCLWILAWPIIYFCKEKFGHSTLKSAWKMNVSEREWYGLHVGEITRKCRGPDCFSNGRIHPNGFPVNMRI